MKSLLSPWMCIILICLTGSLSAEPGGCMSADQRAFDFWVGDWRVETSEGSLLGYNTVELIAGGCALRESWRSATSEYQGTSYNFFNTSTRQWHQSWIDVGGSSLLLNGGLREGSMVLEGEAVTDGKPLQNRISWTPLGDSKVRQHWQVSRDQGRNWEDSFDGYYVKIDLSPDAE